MLWPYPFRVAVRDRREQQELPGRHLEPLLPDAALAQQNGLTSVEQRVHGRAPLFERGRGRDLRHPAASRRNGGTVLGGWRRGGRAWSSRVVVAVTSATAASN